MGWKLEVAPIPVSDEIRFVQLTPPGSASSISLGTGIVDTPPGSVHGTRNAHGQLG